jgi:hypothetical protein
VTRVTDKAKPIVDIIPGKDNDVSLDFTIKATDFIAAQLALPVQISSLVHWAGFSLDNSKADWAVLSSFLKVLARSFEVKSFKWQLLPRFMFMAAKFFPKQLLAVILGELPFRNDMMIGQTTPGNLHPDTITSLLSTAMVQSRRLVYKTLLLPFAAILQVD